MLVCVRVFVFGYNMSVSRDLLENNLNIKISLTIHFLVDLFSSPSTFVFTNQFKLIQTHIKQCRKLSQRTVSIAQHVNS